ncbi:MAG TPA: sigma-70 family RNA polymerase sigma factor [Minicystis sp.]|nr:sigma-70 family RNA polymerase sigma factor [Minicystis sp.]
MQADTRASFTRLMAQHGPGLSRVVASYARPGADHDDLAQEVALAIWRALPTFRGESSERTFVFRIAHLRGLTFVARRRPPAEEGREIEDQRPGPEREADGRERVARLFAAMRRLPVSYRQVLTLALEEMPHAEIAVCLGIAEGNVAVRLSRARAALRRELEEES